MRRLDRNDKTLFACLAGVAVMVGLSFAAVPLYTLFCQVTGFGGTTQRAERAPDEVLDRIVTIRFDANVGQGLDWDFGPEQRTQTIRVGETGVAAYFAHNLSSRAVTGVASYNVMPEKAAVYFNKLACFCFDEQTLAAGAEVDMPVTYFVDPAFARDPAMKDVTEITLSYTFFPALDGDELAAGTAETSARTN